ncbi:mannose-P-dolichol utilization defect 1 protein, partial [Phaenicophaeus curvirostris]|uniref:mannose-P-dolichol utilization defect 1 protein n=1 Tax=Phaenicophaeus curvirostris TaxID=33595 RepID=UPI0037F0CC6C
MAAMEALRPLLVPYFVPDSCFEELCLRLHLLHVPCLKILITKVLGYAIVAGSVLVKLPQVLKVWGARSGAGLSPTALGWSWWRWGAAWPTAPPGASPSGGG